MEFLGIGPLELLAILLIIFVVMGPSDIVKMASTLGTALRNLRKSEMWSAMQRAQKELRSLPDTLARQVDLEDLQDIKKEIQGDLTEGKKGIEDLDREFVAWTRKDGNKQKENSKSTEKAKENPEESSEKNQAESE